MDKENEWDKLLLKFDDNIDALKEISDKMAKILQDRDDSIKKQLGGLNKCKLTQ